MLPPRAVIAKILSPPFSFERLSIVYHIIVMDCKYSQH
jgi:hypothetical protein